MIRYRCPACDAAHECPDEKGGSKGPCPSCGQRLQIPFPATVQTREVKPVTPNEPDVVKVSAKILTWPGACACCLAEPTARLRIVCVRNKDGKREESSTEIPYCAACLAHFNDGRKPTLPSCCSTGPAVAYDRWHGTVHTFRFINREYSRRFRDSNGKKLID